MTRLTGLMMSIGDFCECVWGSIRATLWTVLHLSPCTLAQAVSALSNTPDYACIGVKEKYKINKELVHIPLLLQSTFKGKFVFGAVARKRRCASICSFLLIPLKGRFYRIYFPFLVHLFSFRFILCTRNLSTLAVLGLKVIFP